MNGFVYRRMLKRLRKKKYEVELEYAARLKKSGARNLSREEIEELKEEEELHIQMADCFIKLHEHEFLVSTARKLSITTPHLNDGNSSWVKSMCSSSKILSDRARTELRYKINAEYRGRMHRRILWVTAVAGVLAAIASILAAIAGFH